VVAFMSLHDIDNAAAAIAEAGRILAVGGKLVMAIVHPLNSAGGFDRNVVENPPYIIADAYTEARRYTKVRTRDGLAMTYHGIHRPLNAYADALSSAGLVIEHLREQTTDDRENKWYRIPLFLHIVASRPTPI